VWSGLANEINTLAQATQPTTQGAKMTRHPVRRPVAIALAIACAAALAACGRDDGKKPASQVAVKVNKEEITVHQLNNAMAQFRNLSPEQQKAVAKQVLERMVDQELLVQRAIEKKLDRDPRIMQAMEASRRQILSQAYLDQLAQQIQKPGADEVKKFYDARPELFAERRIYRLQELAIPARPEFTAQALEDEIRKAKSLNDVVAWLKSKNVPFNANSTVKAAEQLPLEVVPKLARLKVGQVMLMPAQQGYLLVQVAATEQQPLDEKQATPFIEQFLLNQKKLELARSEVKQAREAAKIEYVGSFAEGAAAKAPEAPKPAAAKAAEKSAIDKGVAGLR
jgi:EpsD family peptidyl-prolyl cis-trans isomerase